MAPNTSSVYNKAPPQPQQPEAKASDAGVLVTPTPMDAANVPVSAAAASSVSSASGATLSASTSALSTVAAAAAAAGSSPSTNTLRNDDCNVGCFRRRRRQHDADHHHQIDRFTSDEANEDAAALAASERHFAQQLQMSRFARVSPAALDGIKPPLGFRKSCLKRSNSELPADLSVLKHEADAAAAQAGESTVLPTVSEPPMPIRPQQTNRRRCWECKVKVGLTAVTCRCDYTFCNKHRYAEEHKCAFDFKVSAKRKLMSENPRVVPSKVARIN